METNIFKASLCPCISSYFLPQYAKRAVTNLEAALPTNEFDITPKSILYNSVLEPELPYAHITHTPLKSPADKANVIRPCIKEARQRVPP